jgi:glutamate-1-semialdehyde 2,1-aminomutase
MGQNTSSTQKEEALRSMADALRSFPRSRALWEEALAYLPGGMPSSTASPIPIYFERAEGAYVWDVDGNRYLDMNAGMNALPLGNNVPEVRDAICRQANSSYYVQLPFPQVIELARMLCDRFPAADKVQFIESATKAANLAVRLGRAFTGREKFAKFVGGFHGAQFDGVMPGPTKGFMSASGPGSGLPGVPRSVAGDVVLLPWNEPEVCARLIGKHASELGSLIMEPMIGDGYLSPVPGFLQMLRDICNQHRIVLIFDEAVDQTLAPGGAGEYWGVVPDLVIIAKGACGGGLPLAAVGGSEEIMALLNRLSGVPGVPHGSTFAQHALTIAAGIAQLRLLTPQVYQRLHRLGDRLRQGITQFADREGLEALQVTGVGNLSWVHWKHGRLTTYADHMACDERFVGSLHQGLLQAGYFTPMGGRLRLSAGMTDGEIDGFLDTFAGVVKNQIAAGHNG